MSIDQGTALASAPPQATPDAPIDSVESTEASTDVGAALKTTAVFAAEGARRYSALKGEGTECSICFAPLPSEPVCVLIRHVYGNKRSCRHYFHLGCMQLMRKQTPAPHHCPLCREEFQRNEVLPDVRLDSRRWFKLVDAEERGSLDKDEVINALCATLPIEPELLERALNDELWNQWDPEGTGRVTLESFEQPGKGLLHFVLYSLPSLRRDGAAGSSAAVPDMVASREAWFRYWDENGKCSLDFVPFLRALVRTLRLDGAKEEAGVLRAVLLKVWKEYGLVDGNEEAFRPVSLTLFCERPDGFCDGLVHGLKEQFGAAKFKRMLDRVQLLQRPPIELKRELRKLGSAVDAIEKEELVNALLDAREAARETEVPEEAVDPQQQARTQPSSPGASPRVCPDGLKALSVKELQGRLKARNIPYAHCVERADLEDLLMQHGDDGSEPLPAPPSARPESPAPDLNRPAESPPPELNININSVPEANSEQRPGSPHFINFAADGRADGGPPRGHDTADHARNQANMANHGTPGDQATRTSAAPHASAAPQASADASTTAGPPAASPEQQVPPQDDAGDTRLRRCMKGPCCVQ